MSDDEPDLELLELLRQKLIGQPVHDEDDATIGVLEGAEYVNDNGYDVAIDMRSTKRAAETIYDQMQLKAYSTATWSEHELHPKTKDEDTVAFIFTMDLLNFSFWSDLPDDERFAVEYRGRIWKGYWSLVAALQRALDDGIAITDPHFWQNEDECNLDSLRHVFRSCTDEEMPMLRERLECLRECGRILYERYNCSFTKLVSAGGGSAPRLVNLLARDFPCFRDEHEFNGRSKPIRFLKRAQILVADLWACFQGSSYGKFRDIDKITIFADYRVPQILITMGALYCCPPLVAAMKDKRPLESGGSWEVQLRGQFGPTHACGELALTAKVEAACSIWCVELIRREMLRLHPKTRINAILIDFFLYDTMQELEAQGQEALPHHRTRSIWY